MDTPFVFNPPPSDIKCDANISPCNGRADHLSIPPLHYAMLTDDFPLPDNFTFSFGSNADLEFNVDDLEFVVDLHFDPTPSQHLPNAISDDNFFSASPGTEGFDPVSVDQCLIADMASDFGILWNSDPPRAYDTEHFNSDRDSSGRASGNCDRLSSQGSGELNCGDSPVKNPPSPDSCQSARHFSTSSNNSMSKAENRIKIELVGNKSTPKRKKAQDDQGSAETRTSKFIRSSASAEDSCIDLTAGDEEDGKKKARLMRNRESAQLSRQRKKQYVDVLEDKVKSMNSTITELNTRIAYIMAENATLRQHLIGGPPHHGMYPMAPMGYPWMPCPTYVVKPHGSQVPLLPIPRLKPQRPALAPKVTKKSENKKNVGKTKKVASVSFLGLLFSFLLFGGLFPIVNFKYGDRFNVADQFSKIQKGRTLMVDGDLSGISYGGGDTYSGRRDGCGSGTDGSVSVSNYSEPLAAFLYVPRNDRLVKIDGNLIIHSVLASERVMASPGTVQMKTSEETRLAIARNYVPSYHVTGSGRSNTRGSHVDDGRLPQWFREDLSGSMLSSGMCTEVFQFDVSPTPGSTVPATSIINATSSRRYRSTNLKKSRNQRILAEQHIPLNVHALNYTKEHARSTTGKGGLQGNKLSSSMVVSVLVDPREAGDGDVEDVMRSKSFSRILVVVLIDSVKYVTYSCMLPLMGSSPHLVKTCWLENLYTGGKTMRSCPLQNFVHRLRFRIS